MDRPQTKHDQLNWIVVEPGAICQLALTEVSAIDMIDKVKQADMFLPLNQLYVMSVQAKESSEQYNPVKDDAKNLLDAISMTFIH